MITVKFFAQLREVTGCRQLQLTLEQPVSVRDVKQQLVGQGHKWHCLAEQQVLAAVNHTLASPDDEVRPGDEVAFFPPVTGG